MPVLISLEHGLLPPGVCCRNLEFCTKITPLILQGFLGAQFRCENIPSFSAGVLPVTDETKAAAARASRLVASIRANLTPEMPSGDGPYHRGAAAALLELHKKIDRSYKIEGGAAVRNLVRFFAPIVPKCFT